MNRALPFIPVIALFGACSKSNESQPQLETPRDPTHCAYESPPSRAALPPLAPTKIRAGVASEVIPLPIGAPIGGYTGRLRGAGGAALADARARRFTTGFNPTVGMHDAPRVDALAIETGSEVFVLVRADVPYFTDGTLFELERAAAPDGALRGRIMIAASHSHAGWGGFQPTLVLMLGSDKPRKEFADRVVGAMAKAVKDAMAKLEPARIGFAIEKNFDPGNTVTRDRRPDNDTIVGPDGNTAGKSKDPILWAMRVDRADGTPMTALVNLAVHGTVGSDSNPLVSTDAPGAIARALSSELGYPVLHLQGAAGDISPVGDEGRKNCPDGVHCLDMPQLEVFGARAAALVAPLVKGITTGPEAAIEVVTRSFYSGRNAKVARPDGRVLSYAPASEDYEPDGVIFDESGKIATPIDEFNSVGGAGQCGKAGAGSFSPMPNTAGMGVYSSCLDVTRAQNLVLSFFDLPGNRPVPFCDTTRVMATAVRFSGTTSGDYLMLTIPGEPTAPFAAYLRSRSPAGSDRTLLIGYADDHAGYMLTAEDWLAGGYEPSINVWGPLEGEIIMDGILEAAKLAWSPEREDPEAGSSRFVDYTYPAAGPLNATATPDRGTPVTTAPDGMWWPDTADANAPLGATSVPRAVGVARFAWNGGDPLVDLPEIVVEREGTPGIVASSRDGAVVLTYTPVPLRAASPTHHVFGATWQVVAGEPYSLKEPARPFALPLGRYRFSVRGTAKEGPYTVASPWFDVVAAPLAPASSATRAGSAISIRALLGNAPGMRALREKVSDTDVPLRGPWTVVVTAADGTKQTLTVTPGADGVGNVPVTAATSVDVRDAAGNGGVLSISG